MAENLFDANVSLSGANEKKKKPKKRKNLEVDPSNYRVTTLGRLTIYNPVFDYNALTDIFTAQKAQATKPVSADVPVEAPPVTKGDVSFVSDNGQIILRKIRKDRQKGELTGLFKGADAAGAQDETVAPVKDLTYRSMLDTIFRALNKKRDMTEQQRQQVDIEPVIKAQSSKTVQLLNLLDICKASHRTPDHLLSYLSSELKVHATMDDKGIATFKTRITLAQLKYNIKKYQSDYVQCRGCNSFNTLLTRENGSYHVRCNECKANRCVPLIKKFASEGK
ncbi:Eukaryotic translation initiation factor 2 beta subunit [Giardia muris]|uniref:Eukaryotic translation initiation factor 2 beta subunit n=1 Tax=Giardia muris TaxID=5742 RepID=A0A4Z1T587_GIAMU|nr:Eukaryotic translation initiation factor 2 beta subunit [Giardia muris]|eukprot:TNJ27679.1 Eukaryotic translation initiation factor 2 beta subunit [Giardia muris]